MGYLCGRESFAAGKASLARPQSIKANCNLCQFTLMCWAVSYGSSEADSKMIKLLLLQGELLRDQGWMTAGHSNLLRCCTLTHKNLRAKALRRKEGHRGTPWVTVCLNTDPVRYIHVCGTYMCTAMYCLFAVLLPYTLSHSHPYTGLIARKLFFPLSQILVCSLQLLREREECLESMERAI